MMKKKIKTALISVSDKNNLKPLLSVLKKNKIKIISSGGTFKEIKKLKFKCDNYDINIDNSLYFGNKNSYQENQNIFISGLNNESEQIIRWEISKI